LILWATRLDARRLELVDGPLALDSTPGVALVRICAERCGVLLQP
jgi:hypothetical protein